MILIIFMREQVLGLLSLALFGAATAVTAWFPTSGILVITVLSSIGFLPGSGTVLQLQWLSERAPQMLGGYGNRFRATLVVYGVIVVLWEPLNLSYNAVYMAAGGFTVLVTLFCLFAIPQFDGPTPQNKKMVLRRRYWLYYALQFMAGARRQIFVVFAGFMMVERFGFEVHHLTGLIDQPAGQYGGGTDAGRFNPLRGTPHDLEYAGLATVFAYRRDLVRLGRDARGGAHVVDHILFALVALKTIFKRSQTQQILPYRCVAFTINHIAAVFLPVLLGLLWWRSGDGLCGRTYGVVLMA